VQYILQILGYIGISKAIPFGIVRSIMKKYYVSKALVTPKLNFE